MITGAVVQLTVAGAWAAAGLVLLRRRREPLGWIGLAGAAAGAVATLVGGLVARLVLGLLPAAAFHLMLSLPDGRLARRHRGLVVGAYGVGAIAGALMPYGAYGPNRALVAALWLVSLTVGAPLAHVRYRNSGPADRRRLQWFGCAVVIAAEFAMVLLTLRVAASWPPGWHDAALGFTILLPVALIAASSPRVVTRADRLLSHTFALTGLTALVLGVYVLVILGFGHRPTASERPLLILSMIAAAIVALFYGPTRQRLTEFSNRLVYGEREAPDESVRTFATRMTRAVPMDELLQQLTESLRKTLQLAAAEIYTGSRGTYDLAAGVPHVLRLPLVLSEQERSVVARAGISSGTWLDVWLGGLSPGVDRSLLRVAPIAHAGELLGLIALERQADSDPFSDEDDRVLAELARQVGLALHNVQLDSALQRSLEQLREANTELQRSRLRIVTAGDAERRKLERNLHDGAQQHLVAMAVKLRLAEEVIEDDPAEATTMIGDLRANLKDAIAELRALAHGIFPPLLASGGLSEALPAAAGRSPLSSVVDIDGTGRYATEIESCVYFCCLEAMQNAAKHAGEDAELTITVREADGVLSFDVSDDGAGFDLGGRPATGHGFVNMSDRVGAVGGVFSVSSAIGKGTTVHGEIPLH